MTTNGSLLLTGEEPRQLKAGAGIHLKKLNTLKNKNEELEKTFEAKKVIGEISRVENAIEQIKRGNNALNAEERTWAVMWAELYEHNCSAARGTMKGLLHDTIAVELMEEAHMVREQLVPKCREAAGMPAKDPDQGDIMDQPGVDQRKRQTTDTTQQSTPKKKSTKKKATKKKATRRRAAR